MTSSDQQLNIDQFSRDEMILVLEQADLATQAQRPLAPGLRALAEDAPSRNLQRALGELADRMDRGQSFPAAIAALQPSLPPLMKTLVEQSAEIGRLDTVLHWASEQSHRSRALHRQLWSSLAYPLILTCIAAWIGCMLILFIVPVFRHIFDDFGTELPDLTKLILAISEVGKIPGVPIIVAFAPLIVIATVLFLYVNDSLLTNVANWLLSRRWMAAIPLIGPLFRLATLAEFCNLMAVFIELRLPLHKAVMLAGNSTSDQWLRETCQRLGAEIEAGLFHAASLIETGMPVALGQLLCEATSVEALVESLRGLGEIYSARAEVNSRSIGVASEPFIVIGTTLGLGMIVIAMYMPMIKLLNDLS